MDRNDHRYRLVLDLIVPEERRLAPATGTTLLAVSPSTT
jgi:hypothetical protein